MQRLITAQMVLATQPCGAYPAKRLQEMLGEGKRPGACLALLLGLPPADARFCLSRLLSVRGRVRWAEGAAQRARGYAARADAAKSADAAARAAAHAAHAVVAAHAAVAAAYAAVAAADAARAAYYYAAAAYDAEHKLSCILGLEILCEEMC